ncbi:MarR family winged helix-turn-helix transcriptional regulator [uncultured Friedmanniella sp.]|uniref:MarR family winged helix-turn-helix transcriptional regulator n=1 Tax=uncultured Friedmanniella sp. TaxID=335381 RepID=UPI0035CAD227
METPWLSVQEQQVWRRLAAVLELLPGVLNSELSRENGLTHFDYFTLAMLSEAPERTLRMRTLAGLTNASLPRLSNVVSRLASRGLVERRPCEDDRRATDVVLTEAGWAKVVEAAPGHVQTVRASVFDLLDPDQVDQLSIICERLLDGLDPHHRLVGHGRKA